MIKRIMSFVYYRLAVWERYLGLRSYHKPLFERSERHFTRAFELQPRKFDAIIQRGVLRWREMDDYEGAIQDFNFILKVDEENQDVRFFRAMAYNRAGNYPASIRDLELVIEVAPTSRTASDAAKQLRTMYQIMEDLRPPAELDDGPPILLGPPADPAE
jgi:tetratricopeptide (TPR) repeat protein